MNGVRRAAAALYGLHAEDRGAILAGLTSSEQERLSQAMLEMESLGFLRSLGEALVAAESTTPYRGLSTSSGAAIDGLTFAPSFNAGLSPIEIVRAATVEQMQAVLMGEPAVLIAEILKLDSWPWAPALLAGLPVTVRHDVAASMHEPPYELPQARRAWLIEGLATRCAAVDVHSASTAQKAKPRLGFRWLPWRA